VESPVNPQVGKPAPQTRRFPLIETKDLNASALGAAGISAELWRVRAATGWGPDVFLRNLPDL